MPNIIKLKTNLETGARYQALLKEEWEPSLLAPALSLLEDQLRPPTAHIRLPWEATRDAGGKSEVRLISEGATRELVLLLQQLRSPELPPVPTLALERRPDRHMKLVGTALRVAVYLTLQAFWELDGETGLFRDTQSLLFLGTVYELLPELSSAGLIKWRNLLVNVLACHCTIVWRDDPAHQQYLRGILAGYSKNEALERESLVASFRLTDPREHDYLTKAQACLFHFLDYHRYDAAKSFLLNVYRQVPAESLGELQEMFDDIYAEEAAEKKKQRRGRSRSRTRSSSARGLPHARPRNG
jgi:hypothetical protein